MMKLGKIFAMAILAGCVATTAIADEKILKLSTTTGTQSSGLLDVLLPVFKKDTGIDVKVSAEDTNVAIQDAMDGNVDIILVHAKAREDKFVAEGYGTKRYPVMHHDFVILGNSSDLAQIKGMTNAGAVLAKIASAGATFVSRGDESGTHIKEQAVWAASGVVLKENKQTIVRKGKVLKLNYKYPANSEAWYRSIGQNMEGTIKFSEEKLAYTLADRGTFATFKYNKTPSVDLEIFCEGDPVLADPYGIIPVNPKKYPNVQYDLAMKFVEWIRSAKGQNLIDGYQFEDQYGVGKVQLFYADVL